MSFRLSIPCHPDPQYPVIPIHNTLSSRPQWRDLNQSAGDPSASLRMTSWGVIPTLNTLSSRPQWRDRNQSAGDPSASLRMTSWGVIPTHNTLSSRPQWRDLNQSAGDPSASLRMTSWGVIPTLNTLLSRPTIHCHPDPQYPVIPTAVEGSQPVATRLRHIHRSTCPNYRFSFAPPDLLAHSSSD